MDDQVREIERVFVGGEIIAHRAQRRDVERYW